jgi:hypothetical protein
VPFEVVFVWGSDPQALEKLAVALKQFVDGIKQKRLAESPGPGQETAIVFCEHLVDIFGLVGVKIISLYDCPKGLIVKRQFFRFHDHSANPHFFG